MKYRSWVQRIFFLSWTPSLYAKAGHERERAKERERGKGGINKGLLKPRSASFKLLIKPDKSGALKREKKKQKPPHSAARLSLQRASFPSMHRRKKRGER